VTQLNRILIYTKRMSEMAAFYSQHFGYVVKQLPGDRIVELLPDEGGITIMLHPAAKSQKEGQALIKLVFDVADVDGFCRQAKAKGLDFGTVHQADGYAFANAKDPSNNSVSISSRAFAKSAAV
jgi:predicted enzyme related to lactoylglutathione lyase